MKGFLKKIRDPRLLRPILYKVIGRCAIGATAALLWDRFANTGVRLSVLGYAFPVIGAVFGAMAWFAYLRLDGVAPPEFRNPLPQKEPKRRMGDMADYVDEPAVSFGELEPGERTACALAADLICALLFLLPAAVLAVV